MALELGGRADKFGNQYERLWIIRQALRMLEGEAVSIHWEPLGDEGEGIEFRLRLLDGTTEGHQCKSENGTAGRWTAASLKKVLPKAKLQLTTGHVDRFVFVSRDAVPVVRELARRSRHCNDDPAKFLKHSVPSTHREEFDRVCELWGLDSSDEGQHAKALRLLQRLRFRVWDEERESVERAASRLAKGGARAIVACIGDFLFENIGNKVHVDQLRQHLRDAGHPPWDLRAGEIAPAIERLQTEFEDSVGGVLIGESLIPRLETTQLRTLLADSDGPRTVFLHGASGSGKSGVLLELMRELREEGTVVLPVRLDIHRPDSTLEAFSDDMQLPAPPSDCLAALAAGRPAVLILDQLDAIRWTGGHAAKAWVICKEIIERALDFPALRIVVACRTFDLDDDQQIRAWERKTRESALHRLERVEAKKLGDDIVKGVVESHEGVYESMSVRERKLLTNPQCLYVWCAIRQWEEEPQAYHTQTDLLSEFLGRVRRRVTDEMGVQTTDYD
ncbi:MAG TPA: ATP-binding protein, partial [Planctomycetes bacterium]|nr:ATP-binding protein [Planctomycetota bacterium]